EGSFFQPFPPTARTVVYTRRYRETGFLRSRSTDSDREREPGWYVKNPCPCTIFPGYPHCRRRIRTATRRLNSSTNLAETEGADIRVGEYRSRSATPFPMS